MGHPWPVNELRTSCAHPLRGLFLRDLAAADGAPGRAGGFLPLEATTTSTSTAEARRPLARHSSESWNPAFGRQEQQQRLDSSLRWNVKPFARPIYKAVIPAFAGMTSKEKPELAAFGAIQLLAAVVSAWHRAQGGQGLRKFDKTESLTALRAAL